MVQPFQHNEQSPEDAAEARADRQRYEREEPTEPVQPGVERAPGKPTTVDLQPDPPRASLGQDIRDRIVHPHKGDVGRPGTNEEIYQGSKERELD